MHNAKVQGNTKLCIFAFNLFNFFAKLIKLKQDIVQLFPPRLCVYFINPFPFSNAKPLSRKVFFTFHFVWVCLKIIEL